MCELTGLHLDYVSAGAEYPAAGDVLGVATFNGSAAWDAPVSAPSGIPIAQASTPLRPSALPLPESQP